jgi:hypothetical protein
MKQLWQATFKVTDGVCQWRFKAASKEEAEEMADAKFRSHPEWSARYPTPPPCEVRQVPSPTASTPHADVGSGRDNDDN